MKVMIIKVKNPVFPDGTPVYPEEPEYREEVQMYAWPGGYPIFYLTRKGNVLCPECAFEQEREEDSFQDELDPIEAHDVNWEDPTLYCDECCERIESAYAEEEEEE